LAVWDGERLGLVCGSEGKAHGAGSPDELKSLGGPFGPGPEPGPEPGLWIGDKGGADASTVLLTSSRH